MASRVAVSPHDERPTFAEAAADLAGRPASIVSSTAGKVSLVLGAFLILGVVGFVLKVADDGFNDRRAWGYYVAMVSFLLSTAGGAPMLSVAPVLAKANWIRPVMRVSQLFSAIGVLTAIMSIPLIFILPPLVEDEVRRRSIWFGSPSYFPHIFDTIAIFGIVIVGLALLWATSIPDLAAIRENGTGRRQTWARRLAPNFIGTWGQWKVLRMRMGVLAAFYFLFLIFTHILFASDYIHALVPGYKDAIFPMYHALTSLQAGVASVVLAVFVLWKFGGYHRYLGINQMWSLAKLQFALSLMWFYFFFSAFIVFWYSRTPQTEKVIELFDQGPHLWAFLGALFCCFIIPMWTLMWNFIRVSMRGPAIIAAVIIFGTLLDRIRLAVGAWAVETDLGAKALDAVPSTVWPDLWDIFMFLGMFSGAALLYILATRLLPAISLWEIQQSRLISRPGTFMRGEVEIVGKPD
jgi:Ni/Fe-hydrogenase subunit HybB-like protein